MNRYNRGRESEDNVGEVLYRLRRAGDIEAFWRTKRYSEDDRRGVDFWVVYKGVKIPLQVKSSEWGMQRHNARPGQTINCVIGRGDNLAGRIKRALRDYLFDANPPG